MSRPLDERKKGQGKPHGFTSPGGAFVKYWPFVDCHGGEAKTIGAWLALVPPGMQSWVAPAVVIGRFALFLDWWNPGKWFWLGVPANLGARA